MSNVDDYIATLSPNDAALFEQMSEVVKRAVPSVEQGVSYGMSAFFYKGKALISFVVHKQHHSLYPFSGKVIEKLKAELREFPISRGSGSVHFSNEHPIGESLLKEIIEARIREIEQN